MNAPAKPRLRWLLLRSAAFVAVSALLAVGAWQGYRAVLAQPLQRLVFAGEVDRIARADLDALASTVQAAPAESRTPEAVREAARRLPWVREVTVRRRFPDVAEVTFEAHRAAARWGDAQLVSDRGEVFTAPGGDNLPRLRGPDASAAPMVRELPEIVSRLAPLAIAVAEVRLSARGAWEVVLATGLTLELGRGEIGPRMQRFVEAWPRAGEAAAAARYADLRYANGFALRRAADINPTPARAAARKK